MANITIRIPLVGNAIEFDTQEIAVSAGDTVVISLEPEADGKITIGTSGDSLSIQFMKGPSTIPGVDDPPPAN